MLVWVSVVSLFVHLYPKNATTAEPIGLKFSVGPHMTPGKVNRCSKWQKYVSKSFRFLLNFKNARKNIIKSARPIFIVSIVQRPMGIGIIYPVNYICLFYENPGVTGAEVSS